MTTYPAFFISGHPRTKGSWTPVYTKRGIKLRPASGNSAKWFKVLKEQVEEKWTGPLFEEGPVALQLLYLIPRGKTVVRQFPTVRGTGDIDKLERAVLDALTEVVYHDDAQVCDVHHHKEYTNVEPGIWIIVSTDL